MQLKPVVDAISDSFRACEPFVDIVLVTPICGSQGALGGGLQAVRLIAKLPVEKLVVAQGPAD